MLRHDFPEHLDTCNTLCCTVFGRHVKYAILELAKNIMISSIVIIIIIVVDSVTNVRVVTVHWTECGRGGKDGMLTYTLAVIQAVEKTNSTSIYTNSQIKTAAVHL